MRLVLQETGASKVGNVLGMRQELQGEESRVRVAGKDGDKAYLVVSHPGRGETSPCI
jgi:hypothetical protein